MLLRDHPLFNHRGVPSWPPAWTWVSGLDNKHPRGEIGFLRDVHPSNIQPADRCFIYMDFDGASYIGCLLRRIVEVLLANRTKTICGHWQLGPFLYFVEYGDRVLTDTHNWRRLTCQNDSGD